jgi:hypothetical protein
MSDPTFVDPAAPSVSAVRFGDFLALLDLLKNRDAIEAVAKQLRELEVRVAVERENLADAKAEHGDLDARALTLDRRDAELRLLEREQNAKFDDARQELVAQHRRLVEIESAIKFRILRHAGALAGFNPILQSVPSWDAIDRLAGAPVDVVEEMRAPSTELAREGFGGDKFSEQSTLTRSMPMPAMSEHDDLPMPSPPVSNKRPARRGYRAAMRRALASP